MVSPTKKTYEQLTEKQKAFIEFYLQTLNAKQAAIQAGYSENRAEVKGYELKQLLEPHIEARLKNIRNKNIADTNEILELLTRIARGEEKDAFGLDTSNQDKLKALELLGKANQLYVDKVKQETNLDINVNLVDDEDEKDMLPEGTIEADYQLEESDEEDEQHGDKSEKIYR